MILMRGRVAWELNGEAWGGNYLQHERESGKCAFRGGTVPLDLLVRGHVARLRYVPCYGARAVGI